MGFFTNGFSDGVFSECYDSRRDTYPYMQTCQNCMQTTTTFCINHSRKAMYACTVSGHVRKKTAELSTEGNEIDAVNFEKDG